MVLIGYSTTGGAPGHLLMIAMEQYAVIATQGIVGVTGGEITKVEMEKVKRIPLILVDPLLRRP